jgi:hypothetical protein
MSDWVTAHFFLTANLLSSLLLPTIHRNPARVGQRAGFFFSSHLYCHRRLFVSCNEFATAEERVFSSSGSSLTARSGRRSLRDIA